MTFLYQLKTGELRDGFSSVETAAKAGITRLRGYFRFFHVGHVAPDGTVKLTHKVIHYDGENLLCHKIGEPNNAG